MKKNLEWNNLINEKNLSDDFCNNPPRFGWKSCTINDIRGSRYPLFIYQDKCIEHKDYWTPISFFTESAGDIYRELSKNKFYSNEYIKEKLDKLSDIFYWNKMDENEKNKFTSEKEINILKKYKKRVKKWLEITDPDYVIISGKGAMVPICNGEENKAKIQIDTIKLIDKLTDWGLNEINTVDIKIAIKNYINKVKTLLNI